MWDMASLGWSHISVAEPGRLAFLSGQIAATPGSEEVPEDLAGQAKLATASLAAALKDLEATAQDIVMLRVYVVNATSEAFGQAITPLRELLGDAMPSITTIGVQALYKPEIKVEIEMVVRLPEEGNTGHGHRTSAGVSKAEARVSAAIRANISESCRPALHLTPTFRISNAA
jgi:enamine deaminase RidA (YjgF/YER057c/UK114 family)